MYVRGRVGKGQMMGAGRGQRREPVAMAIVTIPPRRLEMVKGMGRKFQGESGEGESDQSLDLTVVKQQLCGLLPQLRGPCHLLEHPGPGREGCCTGL